MDGRSIASNTHCCGCRACEHICPTGAISTVFNDEGFLTAVVEPEKCVGCGLCKSICPALGRKAAFPASQDIFAAVHKEDAVVNRSSSGGMFSAFAQQILRQGGCVYGCGWGPDLRPQHLRIDSESELDTLRRSKYVQSDTGDTYQQVKADLLSGIPVLYVGMPCQIAGLRGYLRKPYDNLCCVDLICHGVPSAPLFAENIAFWETRIGSKLQQYEFRLKPREKFSKYHVTLGSTTGRIWVKPYYYDPYYEGFYNMKSYNEVCYQCPYACAQRTGDITIGDYFWAVEHHEDLAIRNRGRSEAISCLLVNSSQGQNLLSQVRDTLDLYPTKWEWITQRNKNLVRPTPRPPQRDTFYSNIRKLGYPRWAKRYYFSDDFLRNIKGLGKLVRMKEKILNIIQRKVVKR